MAKYNIMIPIANPTAGETPDPRKYSYRKCNVYQTDDPDDAVKEMAGYLLDYFPADFELKDTTNEEDMVFLEKVTVMKVEVLQKMGTDHILSEVADGKKPDS